jgi:predicted Zn-dependent peptidase
MKKSPIFSIILIGIFVLTQCFVFAKDHQLKKAKDKNGYEYEYYTNDDTGLRIYTLKNGLKVYLSVNKDEPRIQTYIAVKAGSTYDPSETTGLAHYLEHMMFKGSSKIATSNWAEEGKYIAELSDLFEKHREAKSAEQKKEIYRKIDSVSQIAATFACPNEYDKMVSSLGAKGTNAYTSEERTVYINNIPSNSFEKWLMLERERFGDLVLRLFHTELETVYEEFNMYQDMDEARVEETMMANLFKKHPYGTQTTIGKPEHLKNPSMVNIMNYWRTYYVPNNMAMCLSGDFDFEATIKLIDKYWGDMKPGNPPKFNPPTEAPMTKPAIAEIHGPDAEFVEFAFRLGGLKSGDKPMITMVDMILSNSKAGLVDLDLVQKQKVLEASTYVDYKKDYSIHYFSGKPREGQTLEQVEQLLMDEIEKIKKGEFDEWLIKAIVKDMKLSRIRSEESNGRAHTFAINFANDEGWQSYLDFIDQLDKITKQEIIDFVKKNYTTNYSLVYKRKGKDENIVKVDKPEITSLKMNRDQQSDFFKKWVAIKEPSIEPVFVDYNKEITKVKLSNGLTLDYIKNKTNELFSLYYIIDMGKNHIQNLPLAVNYLQYIGTDKYSPEDLQKEFFKAGLSFGVSAGADRCYVYVSGLEESFLQGIELIEHFLANAKPDNKIYSDYVAGILKERADNKLNKSSILWGGLMNYGLYGENSAFRAVTPEKELKSINPQDLTNLTKAITSYKHRIFYYGSMNDNNVKGIIEKYHKVPARMKDYPEEKKYAEKIPTKNTVYFVDYDMVQTNIILLSVDQMYDKTLIPYARLFGEYFGSGLSSIVFQEIRESKGLAYSAFAAYTVPSKVDKHHLIYAYVGTQADKLKTATDAMLELMNNMPKAEIQFNGSVDALQKKIESERIIKSSIYFNYLNALDINIDYDIRKDVYNYVKKADIDGMEKFFNEHIKGKKYTFLLIGKKSAINWDVVGQLGEVKELTLEEIFNY